MTTGAREPAPARVKSKFKDVFAVFTAQPYLMSGWS
jgi:hypothetical protein